VVVSVRVGAAEWARIVVLLSDGTAVTVWSFAGPGRPDLRAVDALARWQLAARRRHGTIVVRDPCEELRELLDFSGLGQVLGQTEGGEDSGVEEGMEPGDPIL